MKAKTISSRRAGSSSASSACLSATLIDRLAATASASADGSSISAELDRGLGRQLLVELGVILELVDHRAHQRLRPRRPSGSSSSTSSTSARRCSRRARTRSTSRARFWPSTSTRTVPSGSFSSCSTVAIDAEVVERVAVGIVLARIELGDEEDAPCPPPSPLRARRPICRARRTAARSCAGRRRCRAAEGWGGSESCWAIWAAPASGATKAGTFAPLCFLRAI